MLEGVKIIPLWENASWEENRGLRPLKKSYFSRSLSCLFKKNEVYRVRRTQSMCLLRIDSTINPFGQIKSIQRRMSLDYVNIKSTVSGLLFPSASV
jgi:hypothetical protein